MYSSVVFYDALSETQWGCLGGGGEEDYCPPTLKSSCNFKIKNELKVLGIKRLQ